MTAAHARLALLVAIACLGVAFIALWFAIERKRTRAAAGGSAAGGAAAGGGAAGGGANGRRADGGGEPERAPRARHWPKFVHIAIGALTDFFDTLGIGSFAVTTSLYKLGRIVDDEDIPGTLNAGHAAPTFVQALIYIAVVDVDIVTLVSMLAASATGAYLGAGFVARWSRRRIQIGMGVLLVAAATILVLGQLGLVPQGGAANELAGVRLAAGIAGNFALGALMTLGIGLYAPCMILVSLLGMNPRAAFPIMMGSCAVLMPGAALRFIRRGRYDLRASLGLTIGGVPAVLLAAYLVRSLPLATLKWLVVAVVLYTATMMLRHAIGSRNASTSS